MSVKPNPSPKPKHNKPGEFGEKLEDARFRLTPAPPKPVVLIRLQDKPICTAGNISNIQGPAKSAKSAVLGAMMAAAAKALIGEIPEDQREKEEALLGFRSDLKPDPKNSVILHFDTEQSAYDHHQAVSRAMGRMVTDVTMIAHLPLQSYSLVHFSFIERRNAIEHVIDSLVQQGKRFPCIFLDGVADIVSDPNNFEESSGLVDWFHKITREHKCAVITVLHENPSASENGGGKTRGHLGSHIERKSETNLRVAKDRLVKDTLETSTIWAERARHCYIPKVSGVKIRYDEGTQRHELASGKNEARLKPENQPKEADGSVGSGDTKAANIEDKRLRIEEFLKQTFSALGKDQLSHGKLIPFIVLTFGCSPRTAKTYLTQWRNKGWIFKGLSKNSPYSLTPRKEPEREAAPDQGSADKAEGKPASSTPKPSKAVASGKKPPTSSKTAKKVAIKIAKKAAKNAANKVARKAVKKASK